MGLITLGRNLIAMSRGQALPAPQRTSGAGGFLTTLNLHSLDLRPISTKAEQLDNYVGWVYGCVQKIAQDLRTNPRGLFIRGERRKDWKLVPPEDVHPILQKPNLGQSWGQFIEMRNQHKDITGEAWWHFITNGVAGGKAAGIELIQPDWIDEPIYNNERTAIEAWWVDVPGHTRQRIDARDLILDFYQNPRDRTRGASPVEAFAQAHHMDIYLRAYGVKMIKDGAMISQWVTSKSVKNSQQADEAEARIRRRNRPGSIMVFGEGTELQSAQLPIRDLAFLQTLRPSRDMILAIYGVPPAKFGLTEGVGITNQQTADKAYQENTLLPRLRTFDEIVNEVVLPRLYGKGAGRLAYESENPVEEDREFELKKALDMLKAGATTVEQFFEGLGEEIPPGEDGKVHFLPSTVRVVRSLADAADQDAADPEDADPAPADDPDPAVPEEDGADDDERGARLGALIAKAAATKASLQAELRSLRKKNAQLEFEKVQEKHERVAKGKLRALFEREKKAVRAALTENLRHIAMPKTPMTAEDARAWADAFVVIDKRNWLDDALRRFEDDWRELLEATTLTGAEAGWVLLQQEVVGALAFKIYEQKAAEFARHHAGEHVTDINTTTEAALREAIAEGIEEGKSIPAISARIGEIYDDWKGMRAETIARTETSPSISWGRYQAARETKRRLNMDIRRSWTSLHDDRTRPTHDAADGDSRNQDITLEQFYVVGGVELAHPGDPNAPAAEIVNCFPGETRFYAPDAELLYRQFYVGQLITVQNASGVKLSGTPNHPILTRRGWVPLGELKKGDGIIRTIRSDDARLLSLRNPNKQDVPSTFQQVFDFLAMRRRCRRVRNSDTNFYGDGGTGDVDIVGADSLLGNGRDASLTKPLQHQLLTEAYTGRAATFTPLSNVLPEFGVSTNSRVRGSRQARSLFRASLSHAQEHGFTAIAHLDASAQQPQPYPATGEVEALRQGLFGYAGLIQPHYLVDEVLTIEAVDFIGHVFTAQTAKGYYEIDGGAIAKNCRCSETYRDFNA